MSHYWQYHRLQPLLACKQPVTASKDEDLFITVHQVAELAFHQILLDLDRALAALGDVAAGTAREAAGYDEAAYFLRRVVHLYETVNDTLPVLGTMRGFGEFRAALGPSSGFQSSQFRRLEIMSGVTAPYWRGGTRDASGALHPAEAEFDRVFGEAVCEWFARYRHHSLRWYFEQLVGEEEGDARRDRLAALRAHPPAARLLDLFAAFERAQLRFHRVHLGIAVQQLRRVGVEIGTGGTSFQAYLSTYERKVAPLFAGLSAAPADADAPAGVAMGAPA